jgi:hypothetical protein
MARLAITDGFHVAVGEHGQPEIAELVEMAAEHQKRSDEIELVMDRIEEYAGIELSQREKAAIVRASRGLKLEEFKTNWDDRKDEFATLKNLNPETAELDRRKLLAEFTAIVQTSSESNLRKISTEKVRSEQRARVTPEQWQILERLKATRTPEQKVIKPDLDRSIDYAIERMFQDKCVIKTYELYAAILQHAQGLGVDLEEMKAKVAAHPGVVFGLRNEIGSAEHYRRELESWLMIEKGRGRGVAVSAHGLSERLSDLQRKAVEKLLESKEQFTALSGSSGVGKTEYVIAPLIEQNVKAGHRVFVVAPSDSARDVLRSAASKLSPGSPAVVALKASESLQLYQADPRLREKLATGDMLIIDEASFMSLKQGHNAFKDAFDRGVRVCMIGDLDQGKSIEAGDFFRMAIQSGIDVAELHDIKRQSPEALEGHYLKAVKLFKAGRTTEAFSELHQAGCIRESRGQQRIDAIADSIIRSQAEGVSAIATNLTHRENDAVAEAVRKRMKEQGRLSDEMIVTVYGTLGWTTAQKREIDKLKPGMVLEQTRGKDKGRDWRVEFVDNGKAIARSNGTVRAFDKSHASGFDVCEARQMQMAIGDDILARSANKRDGVANNEWLRVAAWDDQGNPLDEKGRTITHRNLCHAYAATVRRVQGDSATRVIVGYDRHSIKTATRDAAYVAGGRGREFCEIHVESASDLSAIQNRSGDRKAVCEMALDPTREVDRSMREIVEEMERAKAARAPSALDVIKDVDSERGITRGAEIERQVDLQDGKRERDKKVLEHVEIDMEEMIHAAAYYQAANHQQEIERGFDR